jgi:hypothetical protein
MDARIDVIEARLKLAEDHLNSYTNHIAECDPGTRGIWEEAIVGLRKEVSVLKWVLRILQKED